MPTTPADFLLAEALRPKWLKCCSLTLQRVEPQFYCHGRLFVVVPGSAFAARLRQERADLLVRLREEPGLSDIREIVVRVIEDRVPRLMPSAPFPGRRYPQATRCLVSLADAVDDPALKASLARLAGTLSAASAQCAIPPPPMP